MVKKYGIIIVSLILITGSWYLLGSLSAQASCSGTIVGQDGLTYGIVTGGDGNCWLDRNLGATRVATAYNDTSAYGSLYQWGRLYDGHQVPTSGTTATLSSTDVPGNGNFIKSSSDWRSPQNNNLWQGVSGTNNPCPTGFRLPTEPEWITLVASSSITNYSTAYSSSLKLTLNGYRDGASGSLGSMGGQGEYWSSTIHSTQAYLLSIVSSSVYPDNWDNRAVGYGVRCIKDSSSPPVVTINDANNFITFQ